MRPRPFKRANVQHLTFDELEGAGLELAKLAQSLEGNASNNVVVGSSRTVGELFVHCLAIGCVYTCCGVVA